VANFPPGVKISPLGVKFNIGLRLSEFLPMYWAIVYFAQFLGNNGSRPHFGATFFHNRGYALIATKNALGYILGDFLNNPSGHPADLPKPKNYCISM
jgi:hypothetical protein